MWCQNIHSALFGFVTKHACDGQTDRITTKCSRGKIAIFPKDKNHFERTEQLGFRPEEQLAIIIITRHHRRRLCCCLFSALLAKFVQVNQCQDYITLRKTTEKRRSLKNLKQQITADGEATENLPKM